MNGENSASLTKHLDEIGEYLTEYWRDETTASRRLHEKLGLKAVKKKKLERTTESGDMLVVRVVRPVSNVSGEKIDEFEILKRLAEGYYSLRSLDFLLIEGGTDEPDKPTIHVFGGIHWRPNQRGPNQYPILLWREASVEFAIQLVSALFSPETLNNDTVRKLIATLASQDTDLAAPQPIELPAEAKTARSERTSRESIEDHSSMRERDEAIAGDIPREAVFRFALFKTVRDSGPLDRKNLRDMVKKDLSRKESDSFKKEFNAALAWNRDKLCRDANGNLELDMDREEAMNQTVNEFVNKPRGRKVTPERRKDNDPGPNVGESSQSQGRPRQTRSHSTGVATGGGKSGTDSSRSGKLARLLEAGFVQVGTRLVALDERWPREGTVAPEGWIDVEGELYSSPSAAACAVSGRKAESGWTFWAVESRDGPTLFQLRDRLRLGSGRESS